MRRDPTPLQVFTVASPARSSETKASPSSEPPPAGRKPRYDRTLHLASERPPPMPAGAPVSPVLHAEIPAPLAAAAPSAPVPAIAEPRALARRGASLDANDRSAGSPRTFDASPARMIGARLRRARVILHRVVARVAAWLEGLVAWAVGSKS